MSAFSRWLLKTWYSSHPVWFFIPLAWLFWLLAGLRRGAYRLGIFPVASLPVPMVVVGNITVGGTGKTPFVLWLARELQKRGYRPGIVTRGYGGGGRGVYRVDADSDPAVAGDEAVLLARKSGLPVAAGPERPAAARLLVTAGVNVILSDDGLQHYRLPRVHEIVLVDGGRGLGNRWLLPAGPLRESEHRLETVQQVVIKETPGSRFTWPDAARMRLEIGALVSLKDGTRLPLQAFTGKTVHAIAAIGNPQQFFAGLEAAGLVVDGRPLPDHARVTSADLQFGDDRPVFMTEKDAVKCRGLELKNHWYVEVSAAFDGSEAERIVEDVVRKLKT